MSDTVINIDALIPADMAVKAEAVGVKKANGAADQLFGLGVLAGAFIGLGAIFMTTIGAGTAGILPYGVQRLVMGLVFCLGLILVIVGGAELFTGNTLIAMAWASKKVSTAQLARNWAIVYAGNLVGSLLTAGLMFLTKQYTFGSGAIGTMALSVAASKVHLGFLQAIALGIMCNALVCLAVWLTFGARSTTDKIMAIIFPITAFVAAGFEHSIANMYFIPMGLFIKYFDPTFTAGVVEKAGLKIADLNFGTFLLNNLLPVTIGNIIGGSVLVGGVYWFIYLRQRCK